MNAGEMVSTLSVWRRGGLLLEFDAATGALIVDGPPLLAPAVDFLSRPEARIGCLLLLMAEDRQQALASSAQALLRAGAALDFALAERIRVDWHAPALRAWALARTALDELLAAGATAAPIAALEGSSDGNGN